MITKMDLLFLNAQSNAQKNNIFSTQATINVLGTEVPQIALWGVLIVVGFMLFKKKKGK